MIFGLMVMLLGEITLAQCHWPNGNQFFCGTAKAVRLVASQSCETLGARALPLQER